jgi:Mg-chelatase subunit ChlD
MIRAKRVCQMCTMVLLAVQAFAFSTAGRSAAASEPAGAAPSRYVLVLDVSGSMAEGTRLVTMGSGVAATLAILPDAAEVAIVVFHHQAGVLAPLTRLDNASRTALLARVDALRAGGGTDLLAATRQALEVLADGGGTVLLFSDGSQTGASNVPWDEALWGPPARELARKARGQGAVIETLGLGLRDQAEARALLGRLAFETGGEFASIPAPDAMVDAFVALAARLGRHWRRSAPGRFNVVSPQIVIQIVASDAPASLFRVDADGRQIPIDPAYQHVRAGLRVERADLAAGSYAFQPGAQVRRSDLLRPLNVAFALPAESSLPAGRATTVALQTSPIEGVAARVAENLQIHGAFLFGADAKAGSLDVSGASDPQGRVPLRVIAPGALGPFRAILTAETEGWTYRLGPWSGRLVQPQPLNLTLTTPAPAAATWDVQTWGSKTEFVAELQAAGNTEGKLVSLHFQSTNPAIRVEPSEVRLDQLPQAIRLTLTRPIDAAQPSPLDFSLQARAEVDDLAQASLNGTERATSWPVRWTHKRPSLRIRQLGAHELSGVSSAPISTRRGTTIGLSLLLAGTDLEVCPDAGIRIDASPAARQRFALRLRDRSGPLDMLSPSAKEAALELTAVPDLLPGKYELAFTVQSTHADVPLNETTEPISVQVVVVIAPVEVTVETLPAALEPWNERAPIDRVDRLVELLIRAADGGPLPPGVRVEARAEGIPVETVAQEMNLSEKGSLLRQGFRVTIPAQAPPNSGHVKFRVASSPSLAASQEVEWPVVVKPVVVEVALEPAVLKRAKYQGWQERVLGRFRPAAIAPLTVTMNGPWAEARAEWTVADSRGRESVWTSPSGPASRQQIDLGAGPHRVHLRAAYEHTEFASGRDLPIAEEDVVVPAPAWVWLAVAGCLALLGLAVLQPIPCRVCSEGRVIKRGLGKISLNALVSLSTGKLWLRRTAFGYSAGWKGSKRSEPGVRVFLVSSGARQRLDIGESIPVRPGDLIIVEDDRGSRTIEVLGRNAALSSHSIDLYPEDRWNSPLFGDSPAGIEPGTPPRRGAVSSSTGRNS